MNSTQNTRYLSYAQVRQELGSCVRGLGRELIRDFAFVLWGYWKARWAVKYTTVEYMYRCRSVLHVHRDFEVLGSIWALTELFIDCHDALQNLMWHRKLSQKFCAGHWCYFGKIDFWPQSAMVSTSRLRFGYKTSWLSCRLGGRHVNADNMFMQSRWKHKSGRPMNASSSWRIVLQVGRRCPRSWRKVQKIWAKTLLLMKRKLVRDK